MTVTTSTYSDEVVCVPRAGTLYDVLELILDRGMVIDVFVRISLVGIEIIKIDARIVVASVDTYLRFAEACNRLDLETDSTSRTVPELFGGSLAAGAGRVGTKKAARSVGRKVKHAVGLGDEDDGDDRHRGAFHELEDADDRYDDDREAYGEDEDGRRGRAARERDDEPDRDRYEEARERRHARRPAGGSATRYGRRSREG